MTKFVDFKRLFSDNYQKLKKQYLNIQMPPLLSNLYDKQVRIKEF